MLPCNSCIPICWKTEMQFKLKNCNSEKFSNKLRLTAYMPTSLQHNLSTLPSSYQLNPIQGVSWADDSGGGKNACGTYFGHISSTEAPIFMKFETYVYKIVFDHQSNFHKDPCKDSRARGENACTSDALQRFRSEATKIEKMRFSAIFE